MEILNRIVGIAALLLAVPGAVVLLDLLVFWFMGKEARQEYTQSKKEVFNHMRRAMIGPDDIHSAIGQVFGTYATVKRYRAAMDKAVNHIVKQRTL